MKTSHKLLIALVVIILGGMVCTNFILKAEYDDLKVHPRPHAGFQFVEAPAFSHVRINSLSPAINIGIQQHKMGSVQVSDEMQKHLKTRVQNDTLYVDLPETLAVPKLEKEEFPKYANNDYYGLLIRTPNLVSVQMVNGTCRLDNWQTEKAHLELFNKSKLSSGQNHITDLYVATHDQSFVDLYGDEIKNLHATKSEDSKIQIAGVAVSSIQIVK